MSTWTRHGLSFHSTPTIEPKEHLDVIVLNGSNQNGYFIDLRVKLGSPIHLRQGSTDLDWGFSGRRFEGPRGEGEGGSTYSKWNTTICSRSPPPIPILLDEGLLYPSLPPIVSTIFYERGNMKNPSTGKLELGEEIWNSSPRSIKKEPDQDQEEEKLIFIERLLDKGSLIGLIGINSLGIGRKIKSNLMGTTEEGKEEGDLFIWRRKEGEIIYRMGELEGIDLIERIEMDLSKVWIVDEILIDCEGREWIVREVQGW